MNEWAETSFHNTGNSDIIFLHLHTRWLNLDDIIIAIAIALTVQVHRILAWILMNEINVCLDMTHVLAF